MNNLPLLRYAREEDCAALFAIHADAVTTQCHHHYSSLQLAIWLEGRDQQTYLPAISRQDLWLAEDDDGALGFVEVAGATINKLFVAGHAAGRGVGSQLLHHALHMLRQRGYQEIVLESTLNARSFYRRAGFQETGRGVFSGGYSGCTLEIVFMQLA